jgi:hypothetical protein
MHGICIVGENGANCTLYQTSKKYTKQTNKQKKCVKILNYYHFFLLFRIIGSISKLFFTSYFPSSFPFHPCDHPIIGVSTGCLANDVAGRVSFHLAAVVVFVVLITTPLCPKPPTPAAAARARAVARASTCW